MLTARDCDDDDMRQIAHHVRSNSATIEQGLREYARRRLRSPWGVYRWETTGQWVCMRDVIGASGLCETMKAFDGSLALFSSPEAARAAIAKDDAKHKAG